VALLLGLIGLMGIDGVNSVLNGLGLPHLYPPANALRLATGLAAGIALVLLLAPVIARAAWGERDTRPPLSRATELFPYAVAATMAYALIWSAPAWSLYPVAYLSNAGLFGVLVGVNLLAVLALSRRPPVLAGAEAALLPPLGLAGAVCLVELLALAMLRAALLS
jgi:hypothetical protein